MPVVLVVVVSGGGEEEENGTVLNGTGIPEEAPGPIQLKGRPPGEDDEGKGVVIEK